MKLSAGPARDLRIIGIAFVLTALAKPIAYGMVGALMIQSLSLWSVLTVLHFRGRL